MRNRLVIALVLAGLLGPASSSRAATICVSSASGLQSALSIASGNGSDDLVRVRTGTYDAPSNGFVLDSSEDQRLEILGGYTDASCSTRTLDPTNTILRGTGGRVARIRGTQNTIVIEGFTFRDGVTSSDNPGAGLLLNAFAGDGANAVVRSNIFRNNASSSFGGGMAGGSDGGSLTLVNNLFFLNSAGTAHAAASLTVNGPAAYIDNNTVTANLLTSRRGGSGTGGIRIGGTTTASIANNILWGNDGADLALDNSPTSVLVRNDIETLAGTPGLSFDNLDVDPLFEGAGSFRPIDASPVNDWGTNAPAGGAAATDLDGRPRWIGSRIDLGAYESGALLLDAFESGNTTEWDAELP